MDCSRLEDVFGDDEDSRTTLLARFLEQSCTTIGELHRAIEARDAVAVARIAHALKGSSAVVGAERLSRIAARLCEDAAEGRMSDAHRLSNELSTVFEQTRCALTAQSANRTMRLSHASERVI